MTIYTGRSRIIYDRNGDEVTLGDVAWGDTYADQHAADRRLAALAAARDRGDVPSQAANTAAWTIETVLAFSDIPSRAFAVSETRIEGRAASQVVYRVAMPPAAVQDAVTALTADGAQREIKVVDGVLWVRTIVTDPWPLTDPTTDDVPF